VPYFPSATGAASIISLMMEAANTSETSITFYVNTQRNISEDSHHQVGWRF
jgi:hypothetical protein